jgi:DNA polymerase-3 subunit epsilon
MSHFASDTKISKEMKLSLASHKIDVIETDTEVEALLLESAKVKELQPVYNRLLRRKTKQAVLIRQFNDEGYATISVENRELDETTDLSTVYGVYTSRMKAKARLEELMQTFQLCPKLLGLEAAGGRCFRSQLGLCKGACYGNETAATYNQRVEYALERSKLEAWPFDGELYVKISPSKALLVDQWVIKGIVSFEYDSPTIEHISNAFDIDTYKILRSYVRKNPSAISKSLDE